MRKDKFLLGFFIWSLFGFAQKQGNFWYFGGHVGLNFNSATPTVLTNGATTYSSAFCLTEGTSVISDSTGSLLFYSDGQTIWNKNHQIMPNGINLLGNNSSTQSSLIIPQPGSSQYFYLFTTDDFCNDNLQYGFRYSLVDICLDNGLGDIIPNQKNIKLLDTVAEKLIGVKHANGTDYWIIVHKYFSNKFFAFQLSSSGVIDTVVSSIGSVHPTGMVGMGGAIGELKASPDGSKIAIVNGQSYPNIAEYFGFDKSTGVVSNMVSIQTNPNYSYYGVSFSSDNSKLYISCWLNNNGIYQFDLNAGGGNPSSVVASKTQITSNTSYGLRLATNGKIYLARTGSKYLSVINNPNNLGISCNYQDSAIYLNGDTCSEGLPNFIDSYDYSNTTYSCSAGIEKQSSFHSISTYPNPTSGFVSLQSQNVLGLITIYNSLGEVVWQQNSKENTLQINFSERPEGVYFVQIKNNAGIATKKIVVQH